MTDPNVVTPPAPPEPPVPPVTPPAPPAPPTTVTMTQDELDAKFGSTRTQARLTMAQKYGYDSVAAMDAAMEALKTKQDAEKTEVQRLKDEAKALRDSTKSATTEANTLKLEREAERAALAAGADPKQLAAIHKLRDVTDTEIGADGKVDTSLVGKSVTAVLTAYPWLKTGTTTTVGDGSNPPTKSDKTIDEQIAAATKAGDHNLAISLQMSKLNGNTK